jgi:phage terminase large subunit
MSLVLDRNYKPAEIDRKFELIPAQEGFFLSKARHPAYVSAWATGKSMTGIIKAVHLSEKYAGNLGIIFRKEFTDLRDSTIKDFETYTGRKVNSQREVVFDNGSIIMFRHIEEMNNLQNVNLGWFWIEQAEELESDDQFFTLWGRLRRKGVDEKRGYITANTNGHNWIWELWKNGGLEGAELYEAETWENEKNLEPDFLDSLKLLEKKKPKIYNRFVMNSWDEADTTDIVIDPEHVRRAAGRELTGSPVIRRIVSIDVARYGDDKTIFKAIENNEEVRTEEHEKKSTMEVVGLAQIFAKKAFGRDEDCNAFAVDEIGVGGGVADRLAELEFQVVFVNSAERIGVRQDCYNRRAEIYKNGEELFESGRVSILVSDKELGNQLSWAKYKTVKSNGIYQVEAKDDIKKRYKRSPDDADAFLNGLWALPQVKPVERDADKYERRFQKMRRPERSAMSV